MQVNIYMYYTSTFQGLEYIHKSAVKQHGNLKSSNCVIDSRWVCKLTDFGLQKVKTPLHLQVEEIGEHAAYARMYHMHCLGHFNSTYITFVKNDNKVELRKRC